MSHLSELCTCHVWTCDACARVFFGEQIPPSGAHKLEVEEHRRELKETEQALVVLQKEKGSSCQEGFLMTSFFPPNFIHSAPLRAARSLANIQF